MNPPVRIHVDDWVQIAAMSRDQGEQYASFVLHHSRLNAAMALCYQKFLGPLPLFCDYKEVRYRCTGASRMGDVWLAKDLSQEMGYDLRVNVAECLKWGKTP